MYLKSFEEDGTYEVDFTEITNDVVSVGAVQLGIENTEYDVGLIKTAGLQLVLRNDLGKFSEPENSKSIFKLKRKNSIIKITWDIRDYDLICGWFFPGVEPLGGEVEIFRGVLNEVNSASDIDKQQAKFTVLGFESLLSEVTVPFDSITTDSENFPSPGDTISEALFKCLDQAPINELLTVDLSNFVCGYNTTVDEKEFLENKTVSEALKDLLLTGNSVLYIKNNTVYVSAREGSVDLKYTFYGQASIIGIENILGVPDYKDGLNRTFNYWTWKDTTLVSQDVASVDLYGIRKKEFSSPAIFNFSTTKIQASLDANKTEFAFPKIELELQTPMTYSTLALEILDKVSIDYPTIYSPADSNLLPRYGLSNYGAVRYPYAQQSLTITPERRFKIINKKIDVTKQIVSFKLREMDI